MLAYIVDQKRSYSLRRIGEVRHFVASEMIINIIY